MSKTQKKQSNPREPQTLLEAMQYYTDEAKCVDLLSSVKWQDSEKCCPKCGSTNVVGMKTRPKFLCREKGCKKQFSIKVGTIMEDSALPITKWIPAIWLIINAKNGISSYELHRSLGISHKSAWFVLHRIREAISNNSLAKLSGIVEIDETFVGGLSKNKHKSKREPFVKNRRVTGDKITVMGLVERNGNVIAQVIDKRSPKEMIPIIIKHVNKEEAKVFTDAYHAYKKLSGLLYDHSSVDHSSGEYVNGAVHTNSIENFWTLLKRSIKGTYIQVSKQHLNSYVIEQAFRFNTRKMTDAERFRIAVTHIFGKRLTYDELVSRRNKKRA